jgi:hypothetical protein
MYMSSAIESLADLFVPYVLCDEATRPPSVGGHQTEALTGMFRGWGTGPGRDGHRGSDRTERIYTCITFLRLVKRMRIKEAANVVAAYLSGESPESVRKTYYDYGLKCDGIVVCSWLTEMWWIVGSAVVSEGEMPCESPIGSFPMQAKRWREFVQVVRFRYANTTEGEERFTAEFVELWDRLANAIAEERNQALRKRAPR